MIQKTKQNKNKNDTTCTWKSFVAKMLCNYLEALSHKYCTHSLAQCKCWAAAWLKPGSLNRIRNLSNVAYTSKQICIFFPPYQWLLWSAGHVRLWTFLPETNRHNCFRCFHIDMKSFEKAEYLRSKLFPTPMKHTN